MIMLFQEVWTALTRDMKCIVVLLLPQYLRGRDIGIYVLTWQRFIACELRIMFCNNPPADDAQMASIMQKHDDHMHGQMTAC